MKILITGACGVTSRAVARSIKLSKTFENCELIGTDVCQNAYGLYEKLFSRIYCTPHVTDPDYERTLNTISQLEGFDVAIVIPELEVSFWASRKFPCRVILPPPDFCKLAISKRRLHETLNGTGLIPNFEIIRSSEITSGQYRPDLGFPCWIRDIADGATSGKGALLATSPEQLLAWVVLNAAIPEFMISEYLPGRNFACHLLYSGGDILKVACYERLEYFMAKTAISGITGNIARGSLVNDNRIVDISSRGITKLLGSTGETMDGIVAVDLRENATGVPMITEINLRHVAATFSFAKAGFNLSEAHLLVALGRINEIGPKESCWPPGNAILRDIDGEPIWIPKLVLPELGKAL